MHVVRPEHGTYVPKRVAREYNVRFEVIPAVVKKRPVFWDVTPCSPLEVSRRFGGACAAVLATRSMLVSCLAYTSTLMM
jgi:hypothetical protein